MKRVAVRLGALAAAVLVTAGVVHVTGDSDAASRHGRSQADLSIFNAHAAANLAAQTDLERKMSAVSGKSTSPIPEPPQPTAPPRAGDVLTIGPWVSDKPAPDLVPIDLKDGRSGYLRTYDLAFGDQNPAFIRQTRKNSTETVLPVYAEDGQTVIGEFVAGTATSK